DRLRQEETNLRLQREADQQVRALLDGSPLAIAITDGSGAVLLANEAYGRNFGAKPDAGGENIFSCLPAMRPLIPDPGDLGAPTRLETESVGSKASGEAFFAHIWLTVYKADGLLTPADNQLRLAWVLWDASDDLRGRDLAHTESVAIMSRVLLAAFSHE